MPSWRCVRVLRSAHEPLLQVPFASGPIIYMHLHRLWLPKEKQARNILYSMLPMQGANLQLRQRLQDALVELQQAQDQMHILQQLQQELEEGVPGAATLVAAAVAQERALQDARNERVLQMLRSKVGWQVQGGSDGALLIGE